MALTKRQREMLDFIEGFIRFRGYSPSFEEIAEEFGYRSLATVHEHLGNLQAKGYIRKNYNESRSVELVEGKLQVAAVEFRHHNEGIELVDSYVFNPHKWMMVNFDCSAFYVADKAALTDALSIDPPYLRNTQSDAGNVIDYRNWQVPLGRRFRALKLWWVLRSYGAAGIRQMVRHHVAMAQEFAQRLNEDSRFEIVAPHPFSLVCFRVRAADASEEAAERADCATDALAAAVNDSSRAYLTPSKLDGRSIIRVAVGQSRTDRSQMDLLWKLISEAAV